MPPKQPQRTNLNTATETTTRNPKNTSKSKLKSRSRPNSDENEGMIIKTHKGGRQTIKLGSSSRRKKSLLGNTQSSATGPRAFATEIQNFLGNTGSRNLGLGTDDAVDSLAYAGWDAHYSQAAHDTDLRLAVSSGATDKVGLLEEDSEGIQGVGYSEADSPAFDSLTHHFEALSVKDRIVPRSRSNSTRTDIHRTQDVFSDSSTAYNAPSSIFSSSQRHASRAASSSRPNSLFALKRTASATCLFCKARFGPRSRSNSQSQTQNSTTLSSSSSTSYGRCQCHRYSTVFNQRNSFRSIAQQSTPIKLRAKKSSYRIDISSPDVFGTLMDLGSSNSQELRLSQSNVIPEPLSGAQRESQCRTQMTASDSQSSVASAIEQLTQQFVGCTLSPCSSGSDSPDTLSDDDEREVESLLESGLEGSAEDSPSPSPALVRPRRLNPALLSPSLGYIPLAFPLQPQDFPF